MNVYAYKKCMYYVKLGSNFKLGKFENLLISFERQSITDIHSFVDATPWAENEQAFIFTPLNVLWHI